MKAPLIFSLVFIFLTGNLFAQPKDSSEISLFLTHSDTVKTSDSTLTSDSASNKKIKNKLPKKTSSKDSGILVGSIVGAAAGLGVAAILGSFSLEPSSTKKASFGELILGGLIGGVIGGIVGGIASK